MTGFWVGVLGLLVGLSCGWLAGVATAWWVWMKLPQSAGPDQASPPSSGREGQGRETARQRVFEPRQRA
jgi:hypothetical protein